MNINIISGIIISVSIYITVYAIGVKLFGDSYIHIIGFLMGFIACLIIVVIFIAIYESKK